MPSVSSFHAAASQANPAARLRLSGNNDDQVIAKGKSLKGRAVAWLTEVFGGPSAVANRKATKAFLDAVGSEYGAGARDDVYELLRDRLREGMPLRRRHVEMGIRMATTALAAQLTDLGDEAHSTPARTKIEDLVARGALSRAGAQDLLTPGTEAHRQLRKDIMGAVRKAAAQNNGQPLDRPQALIATADAVDEAARRITAAENEALATELADLGDPKRNTVARDTITALRRLGVLSPKEAVKLHESVDLDPKNRKWLEERIKKAVLEAAKQNGDRPLDRRTAIIATEGAVLQEACRVTNVANQELAMRFAGLGENTHARAMIDELVKGELLPSDAAEALLTTHRAGLEALIQKAVRDTIMREVTWNAMSTEARPLTDGEASVRAILDAAPEDEGFPRALKAGEASNLAAAAIGRFMERKAAVLELIKNSDLPPEAKEQLSLSAMTDPEAKTVEYAARLVDLTKDATRLFHSLENAVTHEDFLNALQNYIANFKDRMKGTNPEDWGEDPLMAIISDTMKAGVAGLGDSREALGPVLNKLVGDPGRAVIKGMLAPCTQAELTREEFPTGEALLTLRYGAMAGYCLANHLAARLKVRPDAADGLVDCMGIDKVEDLPPAVEDFVRAQGVDLQPTRRSTRQEGAAKLLQAAAENPRYNFLDLGDAKAFLAGAIESPTEWEDVLDDFQERLDDQAKRHKVEVGGANQRLVDQFTGLDGHGEGSFRELFAGHSARINRGLDSPSLPTDPTNESIPGEAIQSLRDTIQGAILEAGKDQTRRVGDAEARQIAGQTIDTFLRTKAPVLDALNQVNDLSDQERDALARRVWSEPHWGTPGNDITRLVNEHRASQIPLDAIVRDVATKHGLRADLLVTDPFVRDLRTRIIPEDPRLLSLQEATDRALGEADAFCRDKRACLDQIRPSEVNTGDRGVVSRDEGMRLALLDMVVNDPSVRSPDYLGHVVNLVRQMDNLVDQLTTATTGSDKIDAQCNAFGAFSRACRAAGLQRPEEQETFLKRAFDTWVGGLGQRGAEPLRRLADALTEPVSLMVTAGLGALTQSKPSMRVSPVSVDESEFLQSIDGLDRFVKNLALAAAGGTGKTGKDLDNVDRKFQGAAVDAMWPDILHPAVVKVAESRGVKLPLLRLDEGPAAGRGPFSAQAIQRFEDELNEKLQATRGPDDTLLPMFLADIARNSVYRLGDDPWPLPPNTKVAERERRVHVFFGDDKAGKQAVTQVTNQTLGNGVQLKILGGTPFGPFKVQGLLPHQPDPGKIIPPRFEVQRTADGGYHVEFAYDDRLRALQVGTEIVELDGPNSQLRYDGAFTISGDSIRDGRPRARVESLTYDFKFSPKSGDPT
jgi:hypothetical protein